MVRLLEMLEAPGVLLLILGAGWVVRLWRPTARRRCQRCGYDLPESMPEPRCSECAWSFDDERFLYRRYRRRGLTLLAVGVMVLGVLAVRADRIATRGLRGVTPTTLLLLLAQVGEAGPINIEIGQRLRDDTLWWWQRRWLAWIAHPADLDVRIETRAEWPVDIPVRGRLVATFTPNWWTSQHGILVRASRRDDPSVELTFHTWGAMLVTPVRQWIDDTGSLGPGPPESGTIELDVVVIGGPGWNTPAELVTDRHAMTVSIAPVPSIDAVMTPVAHQSMTDCIVRGAYVGLAGPMLDVSFDETGCRSRRVTMGLRLDVVRDDVVIATTRWRTGRRFGRGHWLALQRPDGQPWSGPGPAVGETWTLRVSDDPEFSLSDFGSNERWIGCFEVPLSRNDPSHRAY